MCWLNTQLDTCTTNLDVIPPPLTTTWLPASHNHNCSKSGFHYWVKKCVAPSILFTPNYCSPAPVKLSKNLSATNQIYCNSKTCIPHPWPICSNLHLNPTVTSPKPFHWRPSEQCLSINMMYLDDLDIHVWGVKFNYKQWPFGHFWWMNHIEW